ncbi:beta-ketoacyl synthase N-terminal-like domain-containing protein [Flavobacterium johnsoniae]|uniref:Beta-ketoacyl synthase n=1 Tax=Flavobacterium johnsoniae (strain ATCC 17061 / DSM 2064 / JCM 8514 / BCRC 14874 / CCUG 350202 / NBRC 14942 / NCIMB 11054 / UW101) TaxID=376686 RepID=A5FKY7_FLAJ1|nr:beta-ketoacyl synthase N-terminal-like domain-containing protein [Flavobacterium johnsoniae]ABQ04126.1 beta-ketoacyl synthase [Flavobacterium johnsoniae UW101]OXG02642.1 beta-ketoacyl synthase [Flavobacterium johnsoniae UW101]WQG79004.1 beta-ketoacyl synthase N-terminal-like domain-containing protein [Flavobacterium johnsoniae UW101]SHK13118.1 3-oxoacyl-[acyl-carrier-protein] synthase-1 [Flavobacterium johnsoniae]
MLREIYITETNCITPLGFDVESNVEAILRGDSGIQLHNDISLMPNSFYASIISDEKINSAFSKISTETQYSRLEKMMILALKPIIKKSRVELNSKTAFILSTTKGNVTALANDSEENFNNAHLDVLAKNISDFFGFKTQPIVVSNACVSGILAVSIAKRMIQSELYDNVFVVAGDEVSEFVLSGFNAFQAMSDLPCKPYSKNRTGVSLGEATAAVLVSANPATAKIKVIGDSSINDANHISGPSRTGEGLFRSIQNALKEAQIEADKLDYISAHGTATPYNDEMEAIALNRLGLQNVPVNSLKGFYGHTLGASGLLETVIAIESANQNKLFESKGFDEIGVSEVVNVIEKNQEATIKYFLKTASGFGGCNTAVVFEKVK